MTLKNNAGQAPAPTVPSSPLTATLKIIYCATQAALPIVASFFLGYDQRIAGIHPTVYAIAAFLACCIVLLLQIVFYLHLPDSAPAMLQMVLGPPIWLGLQYLWHPFPLGYYLVSAGVGSMLSIGIAFTYFIVVKNYFQNPASVVRTIKRLVGRGLASVATIILLQIVVLVIPFLIVSYHFTSYLFSEHLTPSGATGVDLVLLLLFVVHSAVQSFLVLQQEGRLDPPARGRAQA